MRHIIVAMTLVFASQYAFSQQLTETAKFSLTGEVVRHGLEIVSIESAQTGAAKGKKSEEKIIILAKVQPLKAGTGVLAKNPWAVLTPYCDYGNSPPSKDLHVGILIIARDGTLEHVLYEPNAKTTPKEAVQLAIKSSKDFVQLADHDPSTTVLEVTSEHCGSRHIYWNGNRFDLVLDNEDFEELP